MRVHTRRRRRWIALGVLLALLLGGTIGGLVASQADASPILRTVTVGDRAFLTLTVDEQTHRAFVVSRQAGTVSVLDTRSGAVARTLTLTPGDVWLAVAARAGRVFISNYAAGTITMLDARSGAVLRTVTDGGDLGLAVDERTDRVFVGDTGGLLMLDARSGAVLRRLPVCGQAFAVAVSAQTGHLFAKCDDETTAMLDAGSGRVLRTVANTTGPYGCLGVDERTDRVFAFGGPETGTGQVDVLDARSGRLLPTHARLIPADGACLTVDARGGIAYEAPLSAGPFPGRVNGTAVVALDGRTGALLRRIRVPANPLCVAVDQRTGWLLVGSAGPANSSDLPTGDGTLSVVRTGDGRVLRGVPIGLTPTDLGIDESAHRALVLNDASDVTTQNQAVTWRPREGWVPQALRHLKHWLPWLPYRAPRPPVPSTSSTVTTLDLTRL